ncbi:MAG: orotidine 5'-phosphate decarboxylase [Acidobacteriia bacterium]|nr:orotidine 5'-phosphate decarboxylase [Terriglobia bacterium]
MAAEGKDVFLDLKFYDIPETVKRATAQVAGLGVHFLTIHGSAPVMSAAVEAKAGSELRLLAVTVLTSFDQQGLADLGHPCPVSDLVDLRVTKAGQCGVDGVVCSPLEVRRVRQIARASDSMAEAASILNEIQLCEA